MKGSSKQKVDFSTLTFDQVIKQLKIIHLALLGGTVINIMLLGYLIGLDQLNFRITHPAILSVAMVVVISLCYIGHILFKKSTNSLHSTASLQEKLISYQQAKILNFALVEGPMLICAIIGFINKDFTLLALALFTSLYFYSLKPSKEEMLTTLPLSGNDKVFFGGGMTLKEHEEKYQ